MEQLAESVTTVARNSIATQKYVSELERVVLDRTDALNRISSDLADAKHSEELAKKAKYNFLSNMSSTLRTPLNGIQLYTELLQEASLDSPALADLERIRTSADELLVSIDKILNYSQVEVGDSTLDLEVTPLTTLILEWELLGKIVSNRNNNTFKFERHSGVPQTVSTDVTKLKQIINTILTNSGKYTKSGVICMSVEFVGDNLEVVISDTGRGMSEEVQKNMFSGLIPNINEIGLGISLPLAKKYLDLLNGEITVRSRENSGSMFILRVPMDHSTQD